MIWIRWVLPAVLALAGVVVLLLEPNSWGLEGFFMCLGAGAAVLLLNVLHRMGVEGDRERRQEDAAREHLRRYGRWPDEDRPDGEERPSGRTTAQSP